MLPESGGTRACMLATRIVGDMLGQDLDGDGAVQARIGGLIDLSHATGADLLDDAIVAEGLADHVRLAGILRRGFQRGNVPVSSLVVGWPQVSVATGAQCM